MARRARRGWAWAPASEPQPSPPPHPGSGAGTPATMGWRAIAATLLGIGLVVMLAIMVRRGQEQSRTRALFVIFLFAIMQVDLSVM